MRAILCAALAAALCVPALADSHAVYKNGDLTITLLQSECVVPPLAAAIKAAGSTTPVKNALVRIGDSEVQACWGVAEDKVLIGDVDGNGGFVLMKDFKEDLGV